MSWRSLRAVRRIMYRGLQGVGGAQVFGRPRDRFRPGIIQSSTARFGASGGLKPARGPACRFRRERSRNRISRSMALSMARGGKIVLSYQYFSSLRIPHFFFRLFEFLYEFLYEAGKVGFRFLNLEGLFDFGCDLSESEGAHIFRPTLSGYGRFLAAAGKSLPATWAFRLPIPLRLSWRNISINVRRSPRLPGPARAAPRGRRPPAFPLPEARRFSSSACMALAPVSEAVFRGSHFSSTSARAQGVIGFVT